jgi:hypothetical protein
LPDDHFTIVSLRRTIDSDTEGMAAADPVTEEPDIRSSGEITVGKGRS